MMKRQNKVKALLLLVAFLIPFLTAPGLAEASDIVRFGGRVNVQAGETVGDAIAFGGAVYIDGTADDVVAFGGAVRSTGNIQGNMVAFGGGVSTEGTVGGDMVAFGGNATVNGPVGGDIIVFGGSVRLGANAVVGGEIVTFGGSVSVHQDAVVGGMIRENPIEALLNGTNLFDGIASISFFIPFWFKVASGILMLTLGWLIGILVSKNTEQVSRTISDEGLKAFGVGLLAKLLAIPITLALLVTIIGIPLIPLFWLVYWLAQLLGMAALGLLLGRAMMDKLNREGVSFGISLFLGLLVLTLIGQVPFLGAITLFILKSVALGAVLISKFGTGRPWLGSGENHVN